MHLLVYLSCMEELVVLLISFSASCEDWHDEASDEGQSDEASGE